MLVATTVEAHRVELTEETAPRTSPGVAVVDVVTVTLCGTDVHIFEDDYVSELPIIQGHETVARVAAIHAGDDSGLAPGDLVAVDPMLTCGHCHACRVGRPNACANMRVLGCHTDGTLRQQLAVPLHRLHRLPPGVPVEIAALWEPVSIASQAVERSRAVRGERAVVIGCGPIGLLAVMRLVERGVHVLAVDRVTTKVDAARRAGAEVGQLAGQAGWPDDQQRAELRWWSEGEGPAVVIEATGVPASLQAAVDVVASAGCVVAVGISTRSASLSMRDLPYKELDLLGSRNSLGLVADSLDFVARRSTSLGPLITHRFGLVDAQLALETAASDPLVGKVAIDVLPAVSMTAQSTGGYP